MLNFQYVLPFPTRLKASGTSSLAATTGLTFPGTDQRELRWCFTICNLDTTNALKLRTSSGVCWHTVPAGQARQFYTSEDINVYNATGFDVSYEVAEFFMSEGNPQAQRASQTAPVGGALLSGGGNGGGTSGGGTSGGGGSYSGGHSYTTPAVP